MAKKKEIPPEQTQGIDRQVLDVIQEEKRKAGGHGMRAPNERRES
jgi:hypothetical protein